MGHVAEVSSLGTHLPVFQQLFSEFDKLQRHANIQEMNRKVQRDQKAFGEFVKMFMTNEFQQKLYRDVVNPIGKDAKQVLQKLVPVLKSGGKSCIWGP